MKPSLIIVGLGNNGSAYDRTRHNAGWMAVDKLAEEFGTGEWKDHAKFRALSCEGRIVTAPVLFLKPLTFMNLSGESVEKAARFFQLNPADQVMVILDEVDLPLGTVRLRMNGSAGTHNGLKSVVEKLGENVPRLRIGIGPKPDGADLANWVLSKFSTEEMETLQSVLKTLPEKVRAFVLGDAASRAGDQE